MEKLGLKAYVWIKKLKQAKLKNDYLELILNLPLKCTISLNGTSDYYANGYDGHPLRELRFSTFKKMKKLELASVLNGTSEEYKIAAWGDVEEPFLVNLHAYVPKELKVSVYSMSEHEMIDEIVANTFPTCVLIPEEGITVDTDNMSELEKAIFNNIKPDNAVDILNGYSDYINISNLRVSSCSVIMENRGYLFEEHGVWKPISNRMKRENKEVFKQVAEVEASWLTI